MKHSFFALLLIFLMVPAGFSKTKQAREKSAIQICRSPNWEQKKTLRILAGKVGMKYSKKRCGPLYKKLRQLKSLNLEPRRIRERRASVKDLSPLKNLAGLENLTLARTRVSDLSPLKKLTRLTQLNIHLT